MEAAAIIFAILAFVAFLIWHRARSDLERRRLRLEVQAQVLEKIGPGQALTDFLRTDEGRRLLEPWAAAGSVADRSKDARRRILVLTTLGFIALFAGFFFVMGVLLPTLLSEDPSSPATVGLLAVLPVLLLAGAGVGALLAAWLMHRLSKKWGMLDATGTAAGNH